MKLFKMLGNIFTEDSVEDKVYIKTENLDFDSLVANYNAKHNSSTQVIAQDKPIEKTTNQPSKKYGQKNSTPESGKKTGITNCYVLYAPNPQSLLVLNNKEKMEFKLFGINHPDKNHAIAKQASTFINDLVKKKTAYFEKVDTDNGVEYKIFLDKEKNKCLNDLLIENDLHESSTPKVNYLTNNEDIKAQYIKPKEKAASVSKAITGIYVKGQQSPYLFDTTNSLSYVVTLKHDNEEKEYWGIDLKRALKENEVKPGDYISIENLGPQMVSVDVPVKDKDKKIIRYETKTVKRNTWEVIILEEKKEILESKTILRADVKKDGLSNCYALFPVSANSFTCMHDSNKKNYELKNINITNLSKEIQSEIKQFLQEKIAKKVVYVKVEDTSNNRVIVYLDKNASISLNEQIYEKFIKNAPSIKNESPKAQVIVPQKNLIVADNMEDDFFEGFDLDGQATSNSIVNNDISPDDNWGDSEEQSSNASKKMAATIAKNKLNPGEKPKKLSFGKPK